MEENKNFETEPCKTKAELMEEINALNKQLEDTVKDKRYWYEAWRKEYSKTEVYEKRMKAMQHTITLLASMVGEVDITALTKEEQA